MTSACFSILNRIFSFFLYGWCPSPMLIILRNFFAGCICRGWWNAWHFIPNFVQETFNSIKLIIHLNDSVLNSEMTSIKFCLSLTCLMFQRYFFYVILIMLRLRRLRSLGGGSCSRIGRLGMIGFSICFSLLEGYNVVAFDSLWKFHETKSFRV